MPEVFTSAIIDAPIARVWEVIRDFNALPAWHPLIAESRIEGGAPSDQVGCVRAFRLKDGGFIRERLLALSDYDCCCTYSILESPMGVTDYVATLRLMPVTDGDRCYAEWTAEFECEPDRADALVTQIGEGVFQGGFDALKERLGG